MIYYHYHHEIPSALASPRWQVPRQVLQPFIPQAVPGEVQDLLSARVVVMGDGSIQEWWTEVSPISWFHGHIMWTYVYMGILSMHQGLITIFSGFIVSMIHQQSEEIMGALLRYVTDKKRIQPIDTGNRMGNTERDSANDMCGNQLIPTILWGYWER